MEKICENCRYWSVEIPEVCTRIDYDDTQIAYLEWEDENWVRFATKPNFGCVLFELKEKE